MGKCKASADLVLLSPHEFHPSLGHRDVLVLLGERGESRQELRFQFQFPGSESLGVIDMESLRVPQPASFPISAGGGSSY